MTQYPATWPCHGSKFPCMVSTADAAPAREAKSSSTANSHGILDQHSIADLTCQAVTDSVFISLVKWYSR